MITFLSNKNGKLSKIALNQVQDLSYSAFMKLLRNKEIKVNDKRTNKDINILSGDKVEIFYCIKEKSKYSVIYKDKEILVVNKKSGYTSESVYSDICKTEKEAKFIHRLDRNTSGIMIFALSLQAEKELLEGFKKHTFIKYYQATVKGQMEKKTDVLTAYLIKDSETSTVKIFKKEVSGGVLIKTGYEVISSDGKTSVLKIRLYTGKTHQIRAHLSFIGHPILGDGKYGDSDFNKIYNVKSQMLSSYKLILNFEKGSKLYYLNGKEFSI